MLKTIENVVALLDEAKLRYCIIGGIGVLLHGGRASTLDCDLYLLAKDGKKLIALFTASRIPCEALGDYQIRAKVRRLSIDVLLDDTTLGKDVLKRAQRLPLGKSVVRVASPEDLIILKTIADRPIDRRDVEEIREIFVGRLDERYIKGQLKKFQP